MFPLLASKMPATYLSRAGAQSAVLYYSAVISSPAVIVTASGGGVAVAAMALLVAFGGVLRNFDAVGGQNGEFVSAQDGCIGCGDNKGYKHC